MKFHPRSRLGVEGVATGPGGLPCAVNAKHSVSRQLATGYFPRNACRNSSSWSVVSRCAVGLSILLMK